MEEEKEGRNVIDSSVGYRSFLKGEDSSLQLKVSFLFKNIILLNKICFFYSIELPK